MKNHERIDIALHHEDSVYGKIDGINSLAPVDSQHVLSTTVIDIHIDGATANSTTYFSTNQFGRGDYEGEVYHSYGKYLDELVRFPSPRAEGRWEGSWRGVEWRVQKRMLVYLGPAQGNVSIFLASS